MLSHNHKPSWTSAVFSIHVYDDFKTKPNIISLDFSLKPGWRSLRSGKIKTAFHLIKGCTQAFVDQSIVPVLCIIL